MKVSIVYATPNPIKTMSLAAGTSYKKDNVSLKRVENCFKRKHMSIAEFGDIQFKIEGISRAASHQLVRHRLCSFVQESQRFNKYDMSNDDTYVIPPSIQEDESKCAEYVDAMRQAGIAYNALLAAGVKAEDARFVLPEATKTTITMKMNAREFFNFLNLRCAPTAQWEIREIANAMADAVWDYNTEWADIMNMYEKYVQELIL